jgi:predicted GNAT family N-acyltransferase
MQLTRLASDTEIAAFDCGDEDLNGFLLNDAKAFMQKKIANTFLLSDGEKVVAYFSLLTDKISKTEAANSNWRKLRSKFPHEKHFNSYPAIKIGRFAVSLEYKDRHIGSELMTYIKRTLHESMNYAAFRFITVDAYLSAIPFYEKNDFRMLVSAEENPYTRSMYFDMMEMEQDK